jgi:sugar transferase EpsL
MTKRILDIALSLIALLLLAPLLVAVAILVRIRLGSPVLFLQLRAGQHGSLFRIAKFRTMANLRDLGGHLLPDHLRLTHLGQTMRRLSLDELPQLWNVLIGEMSLVGPRPLLPEYMPRYNLFQRRRHEVRPGITGWAQVNGRNTLDWEQKLNLDIWYVDNWSLWLDIRILWLTVLKVSQRDGISQQGHATMQEFTGTSNGRSQHE